MQAPTELKYLNKDTYRKILNRSGMRIEEVLPSVRAICEDVRIRGDEALIAYTDRFDGVALRPSQLWVTAEEIEAAYAEVPAGLVDTLQRMSRQITAFHRHQRRRDWTMTRTLGHDAGSSYRLGERNVAVESAGVYVPGGKGPYISTVIMGVVPARVAGVDRVVVSSPPSSGGRMAAALLVAADVAGADAVLKAGGAQAIAALGYGTEQVQPVDVIVGPGNVYVAAAKSVLGNEGRVGVDCLAGPSEIVVLADDTAPPKYVVQDLLSQAEHDADAAGVLVTTSPELAHEVWQRLEALRSEERLNGTTAASMERHGAFLIAQDLTEAIGFVNAFGPEHLEIMTRAPERVLTKIRSAGSVFLGSYSPVAAGDYFSGTNHVLPTAGAARFSSGLSVETFTKRLSYQYLSLPALRAMEADIRMLASFEGPFPRHVDSVTVRTGNDTESSS